MKELGNAASLNSIYASLVACAVTSAGIWAVRKRSDWAERNSSYFISFAAGVIISVSLVHIIPKSISMSTIAPYCVLVGFMGLHLINRFLRIFMCNDRSRRMLSVGVVSMIAIGLHSFIDGIIYSVTFRASVLTGVFATAGMILHEFPEGIVTFMVLEKSGFGRKRSMVLAVITAALTTPLGAIVAYPLVGRIGMSQLGAILGISAGCLTYLGATHLLPSVEKESGSMTVFSLITGIIAAILIMLLGD